MKKMCAVVYIYGRDYQGFIPIYLLSLFNTYPEYSARVYLDGSLDEEVKKCTDLLKDYDFEIVENFTDKLGFTKKALSIDQIQRSIRWFFHDPAFDDFEAIYVSDIDIIICPEKEPIFDRHMIHCNTIGMPYSNISRKKSYLNKKLKPKLVARNLIRFGVVQSLKYYFGKLKYINKLTGLHFYKTKDYKEKAVPVMQEYVKELNLLAEGKSKKYNLCAFNDEAVLYDMMNDCGFGTPPVAENMYNISEDPTEIGYRPHHGIHLGVFRGKIPKNDLPVVKSQLYRSYYEYFKQFKQTEYYKEFEKVFTPYIKTIIGNMERFYDNLD